MFFLESKEDSNSVKSVGSFYSSSHQQQENHYRYFNNYSPNHNRNNNYQNKNGYFTNRSNYKHKNQSLPLSPINARLVDILADRFLSHSDTIEVNKPQDLCNGNEWDVLNCQMWDFYLNNQQTETIYKQKIMLWKEIYNFLGNYFPRYGLFLVGSTLSGFGTNTSDVDMCLLIRQTSIDQRLESLSFLEFLHNRLCKCCKY